MRLLTFFAILIFLTGCDPDEGRTRIRVSNETSIELHNVSYSFGFTEEERIVNNIPPERASDYRRFEQADRCSGWTLAGTFADGLEVRRGVAICTVADPLPPGKYSLLVRRNIFVDNDGTVQTSVSTDIVED